MNTSLAATVGVPDYFRSIPNNLSPQLLAEALAELLAAALAGERPESEWRAYSEQRSLASYARGLCEAVALETQSAVPALVCGQR